MRHVFISYCHEDADFAHVLEDQLKQSGFAVWKDRELRAGDDWHVEIESAIRLASAVVLILSERALTSEYVNFEWAFAVGGGIPVLPLLLKIKTDRLHPRLRSLQALDFSNYMLRPWDDLTRSLKILANVERPFTIAVPRDAPPFIQKAAHELDSMNAAERIAAIELLAEIHDPSVIEVLAEVVKHPAADVRDIAALALAEAKDLRALPAIIDAIRYKRYDYLNVTTLVKLGDAAVPILVTMLRDPAQGVHVRKCIAIALKEIRTDEVIDALHELLQSPEGELRMQAVESLSGEPRALPWILEAIKDKETNWTAMSALQQYRGPEVMAALVEGLKDSQVGMRQVAAEGLKKMPNANAIPALLDALRDDNNVVRSYARVALAEVMDSSWTEKLFEALEETPHKGEIAALLRGLGGEVVFRRMLELLKREDVELRKTAASTLGYLSNRSAVPDLLLALKDENEDVRKMAAFALRDLKDAVAVPDLIAVVRDEFEESEVRRAAALALSEIGTREGRAVYREWERQDKES
jgi:HEAT repeat protein